MTDRPIIFSAPMIRALLDGSKTQMRRVLKDQATWDYVEAIVKCFPEQKSGLPYSVGDRLWVRETVAGEEIGHGELNEGEGGVRYIATNDFERIEDSQEAADRWLQLYYYRAIDPVQCGKNVPPIHMPRWASRITLIVESVKVERLQDISEDDARAEGVDLERFVEISDSAGRHACGDAEPTDPVTEYRELWDSLNAARAPWSSNPWVCAVSFSTIKRNIDHV